MLKKALNIILFLLPVVQASAQLSPGDLARSHAHLEGISNCTQCHELGQKISNDKCLDCHKEIRTRLDDRSGFHASREVRGKNCASCHSDHHGRNFDMVRFDTDDFNHGLTGYDLTGAHARIDCRECHKPDNIDDRELRKRDGTYLGLGTACIDCHTDYHQQTLGNDCAKCHTTEAFEPASGFDHDRTKFPLAGQHETVDCQDCHQMETRNGREFQRFANVPFSNCNSCHEDPHRNQLGTDCRQCHTEQSFTSRSGLRRFNHNQTGFPLKGQHRRVDCFSCHKPDPTPATVFQENIGIATENCAACHEDVHEGRFGTNCAECHTEESFRMTSTPDDFDHSLTGFELEGKHQSVDCRKCHVSESFTDPLPHNTCAACHEDYHQGEFADAGGQSPDCRKCHTVNGFSPSLFTLQDHQSTAFPLEGGHLATPCFACHLQEEEWHFRDIGNRCVDCHDDVHRDEIAEKYYPEQNCTNCHSTESWTSVELFDHSLTDFELEGMHIKTKCSACHVRDEEQPFGHFKEMARDCASCHENVHGSQFAVEGVTDCARCHGFEGWAASYFDHDNTRFPLEGKHAEIACDQCHRESVINGEAVVQYSIERFECIDCHQ